MDLFFVLWVFVIENLNKGNINMEINVFMMSLWMTLHCCGVQYRGKFLTTHWLPVLLKDMISDFKGII